MATPFLSTLRSLRAPSARRSWVPAAVGVTLLAAWTTWMFLGRVAVYEATTSARLEVDRATHPIQAPVAGRVVASSMELARTVEAGEVLFELESDTQRLELEEARARLDAIGPQIAAGRAELEAYADAESDDQSGLPATLAEARARQREADAAAKLAEEQLARARKLGGEALLSGADLERARAEVDQRRAAAEALRLAVARTHWSKRVDASERRVRRGSIARELAALDGEVLKTHAQIDRLEHEIDRRTVRASVSGELADVTPLTVGSVVEEGERVGAIVPPGSLKVVAEFSPPRALGRIKVGQPARLRLDGFPWAQHGTVTATVSRVGHEVREGRVRIELAVDDAPKVIPLQHALPGTIEIEIERTSPALLALRAAGRLLDEAPAPEPERGAAPETTSTPLGRPR